MVEQSNQVCLGYIAVVDTAVGAFVAEDTVEGGAVVVDIVVEDNPVVVE